MIGAQSGKWYYFDGGLGPSEPPAEFSEKVKCFGCGLENDAGMEECARCGESLKEKRSVCPVAAPISRAPIKDVPLAAPRPAHPCLKRGFLPGAAKEDFVLRRLNPASLFFFSGGTGSSWGY